MRRFLARLAFLHRALWQRDQAYRWAVLLGPPPALGCALAVLAWGVLAQVAPGRTGQDARAPWARWSRPVPQEGQPYAEAPTAPLPATDASGRYVGFQAGWLGSIQPIVVDATKDANVLATVLATFTLDQPGIPLARILDAGPSTGLFVGAVRASFVVTAPGPYGFSVRLTRAGARSANCLVRLGSTHHRMVRSITLNAAGRAVLTYPATEFQLQPGLFSLAVAVGCWRGDQVVGAGDLALMVRHPGATALEPAAADELVSPLASDAEAMPSGSIQPRH